MTIDPFAYNQNFASRDVDGGNNYDMDGALAQQGLIPLKDPGLNWFRSSGQGDFSTPEEYWNWVYGGGTVVTGPNGQKYFQTPNGLANVRNQPLQYNEQEFADKAWLIPLAIAGVGLIAGAGVGAGSGAGVGGSYMDSAGFLADYGFTPISQAETLTAVGQSAGLQGQELARFVQSGGEVLQAGGTQQTITSGLQDILKDMGMGNVNLSRVLGAGANVIGSYLTGQEYIKTAQQAAQIADPFASQRGRYQQQLPNYLRRLRQDGNTFERNFKQFDKQYDRRFNNFNRGYQREYGEFERNYNTLNRDFRRDFNREYNEFERGYNNQYKDFRGTLDQMFNDPNYWNENSLLAGLNENATNDTARAMAARGYNMSGNELHEIAQRLQNNNAQFAGQQQQNYTNYATGFLNNYGMTGNARLGNFTQARLGALDNYGDVGLGRLNNFSQTGLQGLNNFAQTNLNQQSNYLNYLNNQLAQVNSVGNFAGANVSDPSKAAYLYQQGMNGQQQMYNDMFGNAGVLMGQFFGNNNGTYY